MTTARDRHRAWTTQLLAARMVRRAAEILAPTARVMPVKGVLVARRYYDDISERRLSDCDLLVLGASASDAARALVSAGMRVAAWSNDSHVVDLVDPAMPGIHVDVHARPLPVGYGAVTAAWMAVGAVEDRAMFGAPVLLPDDGRVLVHLLGNILRDHVIHAYEHTQEDVARVLARSAWSVDAFAAVVRDARLRLGAWSALGNVLTRTLSPRAEALREALALDAAERRYVAWREQVLTAPSGRGGPSLRARIVARAVSDDPRDAAVGVVNAVYGVARGKALRWYARRRG